MKIRESDNGKSREEAEEIVRMRNWSFLTINKMMWGFIAVLLSMIGFFGVHWFNKMEETYTFNDQKFIAILKESKEYTDSIMSQHIKEEKPYWENFYEMKHTLAETHEAVERITNFMEFKYGMPEKKRKP